MSEPGPVALAGFRAEIGFGLGDIASVVREAVAEDRAMASAAARSRIPRLWRDTGVGITDASGDLTIGPVWQAPQGWRINIHRILIDYAGSSPKSPAVASLRVFIAGTNAAATGLLASSDEEALGSSLPAVYEWSNERLSPIVRSGAAAYIRVTAGPASVQVTVTGRGTLTPDD